MITDSKKEEIRDAADLVEVVGDYVRLKRSGNGFIGLCPFHDEKTPSFNVTPRLGIYKCFGCGESGDVFSFVMAMEGVGFNEALRTLAERYGVSLPQEQTPEDDHHHKEREGMYHALRFAGLYYHRQLMESGDGAKARKYLEERGFTKKTIKSFGLGYAPPGGDVLLSEAKREGIEEEYLYRTDLIKPSQKSDGFYDTFRDRLMFPIFNPSGKLIAFAGRILGKEKSAKYINSAQTAVYNKSEVVYGVNFAKNEIRKKEEVILVEGYTDVITLCQHDIRNVVASSGTALTPQQIRVLKRYCNRLVMIYDSDNAGQTAMKRGINIALAEGMDVNLLELPENQDPDSFVKQYGKESFDKLKEKQGADFVTFLIRQAEASGEMEHPGDRTRLIEQVLESIAEIPDQLARQVYVQYLHQKTQKYRNSSDRELFEQLDKILTQKRQTEERQKRFKTSRGKGPEVFTDRPYPPSQEASQTGRPGDRVTGAVPEEQFPGSGDEMPDRHAPPPDEEYYSTSRRKAKRTQYEMELIRLMLNGGGSMISYIGQYCNDQLFEDGELAGFFLDIIDRHQREEDVSIDHYVHREDPYPSLVADIMLEKERPSERSIEKGLLTAYDDGRRIILRAKSALKHLKLSFLNRKIELLSRQHKEAADEEKRRKILMEQQKVQRERRKLNDYRPDELFPDPDGEEKADSGPDKFEYKSIKKQNE